MNSKDYDGRVGDGGGVCGCMIGFVGDVVCVVECEVV